MDSHPFRDTVLRAGELLRIARAAHQVRRAPEQDRNAARRALAGLLADARGVPMKIGQFLASGAADDPFAPLLSGVQALPLETLIPSLEAALGKSVDAVFSEMDTVGIAASLGQVHRAKLLDGTDVAVKIRYPDICRAVDAEMRLAALMPGVGPVRTWGFDLNGYKTTLRDNMQRELDYSGEVQRQRQYRAQAVTGLVVPEPVESLCRPDVLVQHWESGMALAAAANWSPVDRRAVAQVLFRNLFHGLFVTGQVHGDPHAGNLRCRRTSNGAVQVVLYDYGCMIEVPQSARLALLQMIYGCQEQSGVDPFDGFVAMGFDAKKLESIAPQLPALCSILFEPFLQRGPFSTRHWALGRRVDTLLGELKWWFRAAGPASLLLLMRAFHGLVAQLEMLEVALDWRRLLDECIPGELRQEALRLSWPRQTRTSQGFDSMAKYLKVLVSERGDTVVSVAMPAIQLVALEEIIPEEVGRKIAAAGINLADIRHQAVARGIVPQELFRFESGARLYRVWLE